MTEFLSFSDKNVIKHHPTKKNKEKPNRTNSKTKSFSKNK